MHASVAIAEPVSDRIIVTIRGQGPDVVLIPGLATSGAVWDATVAHLQEHYCLHIVQMSASG
jgi:pimeloyl-ACP methyl ester carboxylesterase